MAKKPPVVKIKRGSGAPASLNTGELAVDLTNKDLYVGDANGVPFAVGGGGADATKNYIGFLEQIATPAIPNTGKKLFLDASGKFSTVDNTGKVESLVAGVAPAGTGLVVVDNGSFGSPLPFTNFALAGHVHTTFSDTPPLTPKEGDRWVDSLTVRAYERLNGSWIEIATTTTTTTTT
jgi:hypothetical protein